MYRRCLSKYRLETKMRSVHCSARALRRFDREETTISNLTSIYTVSRERESKK